MAMREAVRYWTGLVKGCLTGVRDSRWCNNLSDQQRWVGTGAERDTGCATFCWRTRLGSLTGGRAGKEARDYFLGTERIAIPKCQVIVRREIVGAMPRLTMR